MSGRPFRSGLASRGTDLCQSFESLRSMMSARANERPNGYPPLAKRTKPSPAQPDASAVQPIGPPLPLQLLRAREAVMQRFRPHLRLLGLTDQQGRILRVLAERNWVEMRELSARTCIHPASLSRMIPRMHQKGIVRRWKDSVDARRVMVAITKRGLALFRAISRQSVLIYARLASEIGTARLRDLYRSLDILIANSAAEAAPGASRRERRHGSPAH